MSDSSYREFLPPEDLASVVKCCWVYKVEDVESIDEKIVADGCPELIINLSAPMSEHTKGAYVRQPDIFVSGQLTRPLRLRGFGEARMVGIRFQPTGLSSMVSTTMDRLTDKRVSACQLFSHAEELLNQTRNSSSDSERIKACFRFLRRGPRNPEVPRPVFDAVQCIHETCGNISINALAHVFDGSLRGLQLAFQCHVGVSPKTYCRIVRFRRALDDVNRLETPTWAHIANCAGLFDQSHLIREFRKFSGDSPIRFLRQGTPLNDAILENQTRLIPQHGPR